MVAEHSDRPPFFPCNVQGEPLMAFPTLVAHPMSRVFRGLKGGVLYDGNVGQFAQLNAGERERCVGLVAGDTGFLGQATGTGVPL